MDDDAQQVVETVPVLQNLGFEVTVLRTASAALEQLSKMSREVDLFVLDRKLPLEAGATATDEVGDLLFAEVNKRFPDSRIIVFSGYTEFEHAQGIMSQSGLLVESKSSRIDRISVLKKQQTVKFDEEVKQLSGFLTRLERVEVETHDSLSPADRRVLLRVADHYEATRIVARRLSGGLTAAQVWSCEIFRSQMRVATIVVKQGNRFPSAGGLQDLLSLPFIARRVDVVKGLMYGDIASVLQLAATDGVSLFHVLGADDGRAADHLQTLTAELDSSLPPGPPGSVTLKALASTIWEWHHVKKALGLYGVPVPDGDMWVNAAERMSHRDLHLGNILVSEGPVIIDADGSGVTSVLTDPIIMMLSSWIHPDSPLSSAEWPQQKDLGLGLLSPEFARSSPYPRFYEELGNWLRKHKGSDREYWAVVLIYSARQLMFENVKESEMLRSRVEFVTRAASEALMS